MIARNPESIDSRIVGNHMFEHSENTYNEWLVPKETWIKNYGKLPEAKELPKDFLVNSVTPGNGYFEPMQKIALIKALKVDDKLYEHLSSILEKRDGKLVMPVSWDDNGMLFEQGDYITNQGYTINAIELKKTYKNIKDKNSTEIIVKGKKISQ